MAPARMRNICFTLNNWLPSDLDNLQKLPYQYVLAAAEVGESGTPHLQGYAELTKPCSLSVLVDLLEKRAHIESAVDKEASVIYCKKGEQPKAEYKSLGLHGPTYGKNVDIQLEKGSRKKPGERTDIHEVASAIMSGKRARDIAEEHPVAFIKYSKGIQSMLSVLDKPRDLRAPLDVVVHYGPTGTGKTHKAIVEFPEAFKYSVSMGSWFDGYEGQQVAIIDEFRGQLPFSFMLQLLDKYACKVQVKGGHREWKPEKIIITSPEHPAFWYPKLEAREGKLKQLKRRLHAIYHFPNPYVAGETTVVRDHTNLEWSAVAAGESAEAAAQFDTGFEP